MTEFDKFVDSKSKDIELDKFPDAEKRRNLIKSYEGQIEYLQRRMGRNERRMARRCKHIKREPFGDIAWCVEMIRRWNLRIDRVRSGEPLENICGTKLTEEG